MRTIHHELHPEHPLHFLLSPPYEGREFTCDACGDDGDTSSYNCSIHQYDLYVECTDLVTRAKRKDHEHPHIVLFPDARIEPDPTCAGRASPRDAGATVAQTAIMARTWIV